ncbi:MAG: M28 family peptidase [Ginsengibacter sp.]
MKYSFFLLFFYTQLLPAQKLSKSDKEIIQNLKREIGYLASDSLEGRRTGSHGEQLAAEYISAQFKNINLVPKGDNDTYLQKFEVNEGKQISPATVLTINNDELIREKDFFPFLFSAEKSLEAVASPAFKENGTPWFLDLRDLTENEKDNPHFDLEKAIKNKAEDFAHKGASSVFVYNSDEQYEEPVFNKYSDANKVTIPVIYLSNQAARRYLHDGSASLDINLTVAFGDKVESGNNVIGYIDNNASGTIILGAHYDHLGYGEDHNSLWTGERAIHNGADDNASGTSAIIELARLIKKSKLKNYNFLFICFSGEELGLYGSKYFTAHPTIDLEKGNYMINADMVGRVNDSSRRLIIGGIGTSPGWGKIIPGKERFFKISLDSSGIGPSDHTSFYLKDIPVLFIFSGLHSDYHKPTDDTEKINFIGELQVIKYIYQIVAATNKMDKLAFSKTKEPKMDNPRFSVSLGIMPDYTYSGNGVRADAIVDGKAAQKAGFLAGDVITALDEMPIHDLYSYMEALGKYKKGDPAKVTIVRDAVSLTFDIIF